MSIGYVLASTADADDGSALLGLLMIGGIIWFLVWAFSSKPKGYDVRVESRGKITPRR